MSSTRRIVLGIAMALLTVATATSQYEQSSRSDNYASRDVGRNGYSYVRETSGGAPSTSLERPLHRARTAISAGDEFSSRTGSRRSGCRRQPPLRGRRDARPVLLALRATG